MEEVNWVTHILYADVVFEYFGIWIQIDEEINREISEIP